MPRKKRQLRADLRRNGFTNRGGKGDHTVWVHPLVPGHVSIDGKDGDDAKRYDEQNVCNALDELAKAKARQQTKGTQP